jgi:hypothetical protein
MVRALGAQMQSVNFVEYGSAGHMDFTVIHYSVASDGLPSNNQFYLQDNIVKDIHLKDSMCSVFAPIYFYKHLN